MWSMCQSSTLGMFFFFIIFLVLSNAQSVFFIPSIPSRYAGNGRLRPVGYASQSKATSKNSRKTVKGKQRQKKGDLDGILSNMGLTPVAKKGNKFERGTPLPKGGKKKTSPKPSRITQMTAPCSSIDLKTQLCYARNGHAALRNFVNEQSLKTVRKKALALASEEELKAWRQKVEVAADSPVLAANCRTVEDCRKELEKLGITESLPFLQYFNTWRKIPEVKELAFSLGEAASILLDCPSVRLYQDSIFWKRKADGPTPWHTDARMAPFDTSHMITFWIPLQKVPKDGTALMFCSKSHADFALPYWNPVTEDIDLDNGSVSEWDRLEHRYPKQIVDYMPLDMGDLTVHSGWTLHCANGNEKNTDRVALAMSFVDAKAEIRPQDHSEIGDNEDKWSYADWVHSVKPRKQFKHELVPIVWPKRG